MSARRQHQTASSVSYTESGLAVIQIEGVVTQPTSAEILAAAQEFTIATTPAGMIADYSRSMLLIDAHKLRQNVRNVVGQHGALRLPVALVVSPDTEQVWADYAWLMAEGGIVRGVFTDAEKASLWLQRKASVWAQAQLDLRRQPLREPARGPFLQAG